MIILIVTIMIIIISIITIITIIIIMIILIIIRISIMCIMTINNMVVIMCVLKTSEDTQHHACSTCTTIRGASSANLKGGRVLLTEVLLPRIARQGAVCLVSIRGLSSKSSN